MPVTDSTSKATAKATGSGRAACRCDEPKATQKADPIALRIAELQAEMDEIQTGLRTNPSNNAARRRLWSLTVLLDALRPQS